MENEQSIHTADIIHVANAMLHGGGFMQSLSETLIRADMRNRRKILTTWEEDITDLWEQWGSTEPQAYRRPRG